MKSKILIIFSIILFCMSSLVWAELPGDYDIIVPNIPPAERSLDKIRVDEVFSFTCGHCYELHQLQPYIEKVFEGKVEIHSKPIGWSGQNPGKFYFLAESLGKGHAIKTQIFEFVFLRNKGKVINNLEVLRSIAILEGLQKEFDAQMTSSELSQKMSKSMRFAKISKIDSTPTLVIENTIKTSRDVPNLFLIFNSLLKEPVKEPLEKFKKLLEEEQKKKPVTKNEKPPQKEGFWTKFKNFFN